MSWQIQRVEKIRKWLGGLRKWILLGHRRDYFKQPAHRLPVERTRTWTTGIWSLHKKCGAVGGAGQQRQRACQRGRARQRRALQRDQVGAACLPLGHLWWCQWKCFYSWGDFFFFKIISPDPNNAQLSLKPSGDASPGDLITITPSVLVEQDGSWAEVRFCWFSFSLIFDFDIVSGAWHWPHCGFWTSALLDNPRTRDLCGGWKT